MVREYQRLDDAGQEKELEKTDWSIINSWLTTLWPELSNTNSYELMIGYVNPEKLTGLYERRQQAIDVFLENSGQVGAEREYLLQMEEQVKKPFAYEWTNGWSQLLGSMTADLGTVMALFIAIVLSGLFAGEWHDNTKPLLLTSRNGWQKIGMAKVCTGFCFAIELFTLLATGMVLSQLFFMGTAGHDMPIQNIKMLSIAPITMLQSGVVPICLCAAGLLGFCRRSDAHFRQCKKQCSCLDCKPRRSIWAYDGSGISPVWFAKSLGFAAAGGKLNRYSLEPIHSTYSEKSFGHLTC